MKTNKKMKNGGSLSGLKASNKRVGPVDPKGAWTKVQNKTLAGAKGKASLTKAAFTEPDVSFCSNILLASLGSGMADAPPSPL